MKIVLLLLLLFITMVYCFQLPRLSQYLYNFRQRPTRFRKRRMLKNNFGQRGSFSNRFHRQRRKTYSSGNQYFQNRGTRTTNQNFENFNNDGGSYRRNRRVRFEDLKKLGCRQLQSNYGPILDKYMRECEGSDQVECSDVKSVIGKKIHFFQLYFYLFKKK